MKGKSCKNNRTRGSRPAARMLAAALALIFIVQFVGCNSCSKPGSDDIDLPNVSLEPVPATKQPGTSSSPSVVSRNGYSVSTSNIYATMVAAQVLDAGGNAVDAAVAAAYTLFTTKTCPNCKAAKAILDRAGIKYDVVDAEDEPELALRYGVMQVPALVVVSFGENGSGNAEKLSGAAWAVNRRRTECPAHKFR